MKNSIKAILVIGTLFILVNVGIIGYVAYTLFQQDGEYNYHMEEGYSVLMKDDQTLTPGEGNKFVIVSFEIYNNGNSPIASSNNMFLLVDTDGHTYSVWGSQEKYKSYEAPKKLEKEERTPFCEIFEVPATVALADLTPDYHGLGKMTEISALILSKIYHLDGTVTEA